MVEPEYIIPQWSVVDDLDPLPFADPEWHGPAANVDSRAQESSTGILKRGSIEHLVDGRVDWLANVLQQPTEPDIVERPIGSGDEGVFGEILPPLDLDDALGLSALFQGIGEFHDLMLDRNLHIIGGE